MTIKPGTTVLIKRDLIIGQVQGMRAGMAREAPEDQFYIVEVDAKQFCRESELVVVPDSPPQPMDIFREANKKFQENPNLETASELARAYNNLPGKPNKPLK